MSNVKIPGNLKYTKISVESCPGLLDINNITLKKRDLGSLFTSFSLERPHVQLHSVPLYPVGPLVQSCHGEKNVTYTDLETTLQHSWYSSKVSCLSTKLLQPYLENWHECSLRFRCSLFLHFFY